MHRYGARLLWTSIAVAAGVVVWSPAPALGASTGLGLTGSSDHAVYRIGQPIALRWVVTNAGTTPCRVSKVPDGSIAITSVARDGASILPEFHSVSYYDGIGSLIRANLVSVGAGGTLSLEDSSQTLPAGTGSVQIFSTASWSPSERDLSAEWALSTPGSYVVTAVYAVPRVNGLPDDVCRGASTMATVRFTVGAARSGILLWTVYLAIAAAALVLITLGWLWWRARRRRVAGAALLTVMLTVTVVVGWASQAHADVSIHGDQAFHNDVAYCIGDFEKPPHGADPGGDPALVWNDVNSSSRHIEIWQARWGDKPIQ